MSPGVAELAADLAAALGAREVRDVQRLSGGASRETFAFEADGRALILQRDRPGGMRQAGMAAEARLLRAAAASGVPVPGVVATDADADGPGVAGTALEVYLSALGIALLVQARLTRPGTGSGRRG